MRAPRPGTGNQDEAGEFFRADERERRPVSARNGAACGSVKGYLDTASTSNEHPDSAYHMPGTELRSPAHRHRNAGAHLTHLLDHESPPDPRRLPESSRPVAGGSSSASKERASRLPADTSWSRAAVRRLAAGLLLVVAGLLGVSTAAHAQTTLVSNIGQTVSTSDRVVGISGAFQFTQAQPFTTGDNADGYTLSEVVVKVGSDASSLDVPRVSIYSSSSGNPGTSLYTLTNPVSFASGDMIFPAPANATLAKETDYFVVIEETVGNWKLNSTSSDGEGTVESGWSIGDTHAWRNLDAGAWSSNSRSLLITIKGTVNGGPTLSTDATLSALALSGVALDEAFAPATEDYTATVVNSVMETTVTATTTHSGATVAFKDGDDNALTNPVTLDVGDNVIKAVVTAEDLTAMKTYMVTVTREGTTTVPGAPTGLTATASGTSTIDLDWTAPSDDGGSPITGYRIEVSSDGGSSWIDLVADTDETNTTYSHTGLTAGNTRHYRVSAINSAGTGAASGTANATTETAVVTPTETEVAADWDLKPSGLSGGDKFRLLFITSTSRNAVPTAIADYNTFVQNRAAAGHSEIQTHSSGFRAVGSTEDVDARDNTSTTYTSSDKGVPIYWLDGNKVVDDYEDFYDGDWDEETTLKNESGTTKTATGTTTVWTGSNHDGTEATAFGFSNALGSNPARTGRPGTSTTAGPLTSTGTVANVANTETRRMYGLSSVFVVEDGPTLSSDATLSALELSGVTLAPTFVSATEDYTATVVNSVMQTTVTATPTHSGATVALKYGDDTPLTNPVTLAVGANVIKAVVTAEDLTMKTYMVTVTREGTTDTPVTIEAEYESIGAGLEDLLFTLTREGETTEALDVTVTITQDQSWLSNIEYTVTFPANSATAELTITASNISFTPSTTGDLTATVSGDGIAGGSDMVKIISTSGPPITISYEESEYTFAEEATDEAIYVLATLDAAYPRGPGPSISVPIAFSSRSGTAVSPEDFAAITWNPNFLRSDFERDVETDPLVARKAVPGFAIVNDNIYEGSESFVMTIEFAPGLSADLVQFANPDGTTCKGFSCAPEYTVNITDEGDLPELSLSVDPSSIAEEDDDVTTGVSENVSTVTVRITNGKTFAEDQTVTLAFSGTATQGTHYSVLPGDADTNTPGHQVDLMVGKTAQVTVTATGNDTDDGPRTVTVAADLEEAAIGSRDITILDDDTPTTQPAIESKNLVEMSEGNTASLGVTLSIAPTSDRTVGITSGDTVAVTVTSSSLTFTSANWNVEQFFDISAVEDSDGDNENVTLTLSGTGLTSKTVTVTVTDDDNPPGAPTGLTATASGTSTINLSWTAPADDGGASISGYKIEVSPNGSSGWSNREANTGSTSTSYSHTGLDAGTTRHYRVSAINSVGTGAASNVDDATTDDDAATVPGTPTGLTATASGTSTINLTWNAPSSDGGASISGYRIEISPNGTSSWTNRVGNTNSTSTSYAHTGLSPGTTRHYRVSAINSVGTGAASNVDDATTDDAAATVPGTPTGLTATASGTSTINLTWNAPSSDGGASISGYRIEISPNGTSSWTNRVGNTNSTSTSYAHTGLSAGTTRHYRVSAINSVGTGAASNVDDATTDDAAATVPGTPTGLTATASGTSTINLTWNAPSSDGGASISGYRIEISPNGTSSWTNRVGNTNSTSTSYAHTGLSAGTTRHYRVSAINSVGTGAASNVDDATTDDAAATVPGTPTGLTATASGTSTINLTWNAPSSDGGASISGYRIEISPNGTSSWTNRVGNTNSTSTSYAHTGLSAGTTRHYRVSAINSVGTGAASNVDDATTDDAAQPGLAVVTVHALATSVPAGGLARFELRRSGGDMEKGLKVSYRHDESDGNYVRSWGYFKPGVTVKGADYGVGQSAGTVTARVTGPSDPLCTPTDPSHASCTDNYTVGNPSSASMQVTASASSSADALEDALTLVDGLTPDVAAAVLLGEQTLGEAELAALDRLGNGNGRYDLGDLLSWIDRCRRGEAHCGRTSTDSGPAAAALLGAAAAGGRSTPRRPGRRGSGRPGRKPIRTARRRGRFAGYALATLLAATLTLSCTEGSVAPAAYAPDPGFLTVEWIGPAAHRDVGVLLEFEGPAIDAVRAPGFELYESSASGRHRIVVAGSLRPGPFVQFRVPDRGQLPLYSVRVLEVTGEGYGLRDPTEYRAVVVMN